MLATLSSVAVFLIAAPPADAAPAKPAGIAAAAAIATPNAGDASARQTAVALNYCRASLHRIRTTPSPQVLAEERDRVLDNLSLDAIADPEVIGLYSALLDEINQVGLARTERRLVVDGTARGIRRKLVWDSVAFAGQVATAQYVGALRTGADSWWDIRDRQDRKATELLKVDRKQMESITAKSTLFLDTFWKLARRRDIPDAWLIRGGDLDRLAAAVGEPRDDVRLRRLRRLEPFLTAYPPYWYHVARTQQALGSFDDAIATYARLSELESGQFRIDEMLAAAETNWALLLDAAGDPHAVEIAERALTRAPTVWQANLAAAGIFERHARLDDAEEALLRNVDADIARPISQTFRLAMLARTDQTERLAELVTRPEVVADVPAPALLRCVATLEADASRPVVQRLGRSIAAYPRGAFGADDLILTADENWNLPRARFRFPSQPQTAMPEVAAVRGGHAVRFSGVALPGSGDEVDVELAYPDGTTLVMTFQREGRRTLRPVLTLTRAQVGDRRLSFEPAGLPRQAAIPTEWEVY